MGKVFRSGILPLTDTTPLETLGLKVICDLRSVEEVAESPDRMPVNAKPQYMHLPLETEENFGERLRAILFNKKRLSHIMLKTYTHIMIDNNALRFGSLLKFLANADNLPLLFHCTAGKDRTGVAAALLLLLLGVPEDVIIADYTLSNFYHADFRKVTERMIRPLRRLRITVDDLYPLLVADAKIIRAAIEHIHANYGSVESYLTSKAGLTQQEIKQIKANLLAS